jgi:hypothetical protein
VPSFGVSTAADIVSRISELRQQFPEHHIRTRKISVTAVGISDRSGVCAIERPRGMMEWMALPAFVIDAFNNIVAERFLRKGPPEQR